MKRELTAAEAELQIEAIRKRNRTINRAMILYAVFLLGLLAGLALAPSTLPMFRWACMPEYRDGPILNLNH